MREDLMMVEDAPVSHSTSAEESVPPGYKRTEVGVIPEDWVVSPISGIGEVKGGKRLPKGSNLTEVPNGHPYIRVSDMFDGGVALGCIMYVPDAVYSIIKNYRIFQEDIFISVAGTLGIIGKVPKELDGANLTENADRITEISCNRDYLLYWLMSDPIRMIIEAEKTVGAQPKLALSRIESFLVALPCDIEEQSSIAAALSDTDALIASLDKLIAKKRDMKAAAMQQLLTGRERLPGFSGEWVCHELSELGAFLKGKGIKRDEVAAEGIPCIRYGEIYTRYNDYARELHSFIPAKVAKQSQRIQQGDLLFAGSGETAEEIGKCIAYLGDQEAYAGGDIVVFTPANQNSMFLGYLMNDVSVVSQKARLGQGDAVVHISARNLGQLQIQLPSIEEQRAIAAVLSDMDAEIAALEARRDKTRAIKQGMMQELLTGKTRLL